MIRTIARLADYCCSFAWMNDGVEMVRSVSYRPSKAFQFSAEEQAKYKDIAAKAKTSAKAPTESANSIEASLATVAEYEGKVWTPADDVVDEKDGEFVGFTLDAAMLSTGAIDVDTSDVFFEEPREVVENSENVDSDEQKVAEQLQALLGKLQDANTIVEGKLEEEPDDSLGKDAVSVHLQSLSGEEFHAMQGPLYVAQIVGDFASRSKDDPDLSKQKRSEVQPRILHGDRELRQSELVGGSGWPLEIRLTVIWPRYVNDDAEFRALENEWHVKSQILEREIMLAKMEEDCAVREAQVAQSEGSPQSSTWKKRQQNEASRTRRAESRHMLSLELQELKARLMEARSARGLPLLD